MLSMLQSKLIALARFFELLFRVRLMVRSELDSKEDCGGIVDGLVCDYR